MTDDFTPTTEQVRDGYASDPEAEYRDPIGYGSYEAGLRRAFDRWLVQHDKALLAAAEAKLDAVRKYADERAWYGQRNRIANSARIASDLFQILGLGPDGKVSDGQQ